MDGPQGSPPEVLALTKGRRTCSQRSLLWCDSQAGEGPNCQSKRNLLEDLAKLHKQYERGWSKLQKDVDAVDGTSSFQDLHGLHKSLIDQFLVCATGRPDRQHPKLAEHL